MKLQPLTIENQIKKLRLRYNLFTNAEKVGEQAEAFYEALENFEDDVVVIACKWFDGEKFPTSGQLKKKCWDIKEKKHSPLQTAGSTWHCANNTPECKSWPINQTQANLSQRQFGGIVVCYICEQRIKAKKWPGGIEDLLLRQMYPDISQQP